MNAAFAASLIDDLLGLELGATTEAGNRLTLDRLTVRAKPDGTMELGIGSVEAASLRMAWGPLVLEAGRLVLDTVAAQVRIDADGPRLWSLEAAGARLSGVKVQGPATLPQRSPPGVGASGMPVGASTAGEIPLAPQGPGAWRIAPLATADGTIRAEILDAHLMFDAQVTVRVRQGEVDFNDATVEHVGPDSRMGVSRLGVYVDAPNGRSYLCQFPSAPVAGVEYEERGALLGRVTSRGKLRLDAFAPGLLRQARGGHGLGFTDQARLLLHRAAVTGELQLGDGQVTAPGLQADLVGRAEHRNLVRLHSEAVGRGITVQVPSLSIGPAVFGMEGRQLRADATTGSVDLRLSVEDAQLRFAFELQALEVSGLRLGPHRAGDAPAAA
jgi:hypothetical protein